MPSSSSAAYLPLMGDDFDESKNTSTESSSRQWSQIGALFLPWLLLGSSFLNIVLLSSLWMPTKNVEVSSQALYSPAQDVIEHKTVKFHSGFGADMPIYDRAPSPEVDAAWDGLYEFSLNKVTRDEAARIANKTWPILGEEDHYMIALDVFHQLHCLNEMRKAMYPEYYPITGEGIHTPHMRHCISSLRQSITCSSDITPIVWQWSEKSKAAKERSDVVHTCRNFDKIKEWAQDHFVPRQQNMSIYIMDDLPDIPTV